MIRLRASLTTFMAIVAFVVGVVFGCQDELTEEKEPLGPEVDPQIVLNAIDSARGNKSVLELTEGQAVHIEHNQKVELGAPQIVQDQVLNVYHRAEVDDTIKIVLVRTTYSYPDGVEGKPEIVQEELDPILIEKSGGLPAPQTQKASLAKPAPYSNATIQSFSKGNIEAFQEASPAAEKTTIHNFTVDSVVHPVPAEVAKTPNCLNIPNCQLPAQRIKFDVVQWVGSEWNRANIELIISAKAPLLATDLLSCQAFLYKEESMSRDYYIRQCSTVRNFRY